jgi:hypothetical protein
LAVCNALVAGVREQAAALTGDRALWLRYYEERLLQYAQWLSDAAAVLEPQSFVIHTHSPPCTFSTAPVM